MLEIRQITIVGSYSFEGMAVFLRVIVHLCPFVVCRGSHCESPYSHRMDHTKCLNDKLFLIFNYNVPDSQILLNCRIK